MKFPKSIKVYGDQAYRNKKCPPESAEQVTFFNVLRRDYPELGAIAIHPRNEGKKTMAQVRRQKAEGMTPGASDIIIPGSPTFVCELKKQDHTMCKWEPEQIPYLEACQKAGAFTCIALGYKAALEALQEWMK